MGIEQDPELRDGVGGEPTETRYPNGGVLPDRDLPDYGEVYPDEDAHFKAVEVLVDQGVANYAEAREAKKYNADMYEAEADTPNRDPKPGVAVELGERAAAVAQLMDGISEQNKAAGALSALDHGATFSRQYSNPGQVVDRMVAKASKYEHAEDEAIETLSKTAALRAIGFSEQDVTESQESIDHALIPLRVASPQASRARRKQKEITERTAHTVHQKKNTP